MKKRKKHKIIHITLKDPKLLEDKAVKKWIAHLEHELGLEVKLQMEAQTKLFIYGTTL